MAKDFKKTVKVQELAKELFQDANFDFNSSNAIQRQNYIYISDFDFENKFENTEKRDKFIEFLKLVDYFDIRSISEKELQITFSVNDIEIGIEKSVIGI